MSALKRKDAPAHPSKSSKSGTEARPAKRTKSTKPVKDVGKRAAKDEKEPAPARSSTIAVTSQMKEEEPLFPRGGGSILTPLEHKQIQIQAKNDVLFEQESGEPAKKDAAYKRKRKSSLSVEQLKAKIRDEDAVKPESLNYKRLKRSSLVLGQICEIKPLELVLSLPNNLTGYVPITGISETLTNRLQGVAAEGAGLEDDDEEAAAKDVDLGSMFEIGQYLRAYVVSTTEDSAVTAGKVRHHIELSLQPELANAGLGEHGVVENVTIMASVSSVEDHGLVMDLGMPDSGLRGFLPKKQLDGSIPPERLQPGAVVLCTTLGKKSKIVQLSTLKKKLGNIKNHPSQATTIDSFLPGTAVDVLVSEVSHRGIVGKVMGHLDVTADLFHSGAGPDTVDIESKYAVGSRLKARVICTFPEADKPKLGMSLLPHVTSMTPKVAVKDGGEANPLTTLPNSSLVEKCVVRKVEPGIGLFVDVGVDGVSGFVHISRVKDGKVDALYENSGPYKVDSAHPGRVVGYSSFDGVYLISLEQSVREQQFLRIEDIPIGDVVSGVVERLVINKDGLGGITVELADGISGLVPEMHLADIHLQHPEKKFRPGMKVKARVLSTDPSKHQIRLTLKKTLVNSEAPALMTHDDAMVGMQVPGTIVKVLDNGAVVQFYGTLRGYLPVSEMSEAYIADPKEHFRPGQVVNVHVLSCDPESERLIVSCKDPSAFGLEKQLALKKLSLGDLVSAKVTQKTEDDVFVELTDGELRATLPVGHLTDKSAKKSQSALKKIGVGQTLTDLVVLVKNESRRLILLSRKPSLVKAAKEGTLLTSIEQAQVGQVVAGFVDNIIPTAAFVQFAGRLTALLPKSLMPSEIREKDKFGLRKFQSLDVKIVTLDREQGRIVAKIPSDTDNDVGKTAKSDEKITNALDDSIRTIEHVVVGKIVKVRVSEVKETQLNVQIADNVHGRIDVSQVFDNWQEIANTKRPLAEYRPKQIIRARILGVHDARNHAFLPISHRSGHSIIELSCKPSDLVAEILPERKSFDKLEVGSTHVGFVNNYLRSCLWVTLSPGVRGRVNAMEAADDLTLAQDLAANFPIGSALRVRVIAVNAVEKHIDLSGRIGPVSELSWENVEQGIVVAGKVTKVQDWRVSVQLSPTLAGPVLLVDLADDYDEANTSKFNKNDIIRVAIVELDKSNKKLRLSTRPSRILSSTLPVKDKEVTKTVPLQVGEVIRGFIKNVGDKGLFINLGGGVTAMVQIRDISDEYLKDWKEHFQVDQVVKGRIVSLNEGRITMSLKKSVVEKDWKPSVTISDLKADQMVEGRVRRVESFGVFVEIVGGDRLTGLCHRSEIADQPVIDPSKLYSVGDRVKAKVLRVNVEKKRIDLGLKASYMAADDSDMEDEEDDDGAMLDMEGEDREATDEEMGDSDDGGVAIFTGPTGAKMPITASDDEDSDVDMAHADANTTSAGLDAGGFDWSGGAALDVDDDMDMGGSSIKQPAKKTTKRREPEIQVDRTAELDVNGPQTASDYERLLLGQPDSSQLWIEYMAFQMKVSELSKAREVAERAIKSINIREEAEKLNLWVAYLNLEVAYGSEDTVEEVFKRACTYNDELEVHERLASIYIHAKLLKRADDTYETMVKKFGSKSLKVWVNYAHFLHTTAKEVERARALLKRATQALDADNDPHTYLGLVTKFAALEFRSPTGDREQGRTLFASLLASWPKKFDLWNQLLDLETAAHAGDEKLGRADPAPVRDVFERGAKVKGLKPRRAKVWFQRWARWEDGCGDAKSREGVSARAQEWARAAEERKKKAAAKEDDGEEEEDEK